MNIGKEPVPKSVRSATKSILWMSFYKSEPTHWSLWSVGLQPFRTTDHPQCENSARTSHILSDPLSLPCRTCPANGGDSFGIPWAWAAGIALQSGYIRILSNMWECSDLHKLSTPWKTRIWPVRLWTWGEKNLNIHWATLQNPWTGFLIKMAE